MSSMAKTNTKFTPPQLARLWGIGYDKVVAWIRSGELRAINAATTPGGRPRYLIDEADIKSFELRRAVSPPPPPQPRKRRHTDDFKRYFSKGR